MSLETQLRDHSAQDKENFERISDELKEIRTEVKGISEVLQKQRGFIAGFSSAFTLLVTMLVGLVVYIWNNMR